MHRSLSLRSSAALSVLPILLLLNLEPARASSHSPRLLLHARQTTSKVGNTCASGALTSCADAVTHGFFDPDGNLFYHVYLIAAGFDTAGGAREVHVGLNYDLTTLSGVDIFDWTYCSDLETPGGGWYQSGGDNRLSWETKGNDSLRVAGFFYVSAYSPGYFALVPPAGGSAILTPFTGPPDTLEAASLGFIGFGSLEGCNPCLTSCDYTPVRPSTWSSIKLFLRSP